MNGTTAAKAAWPGLIRTHSSVSPRHHRVGMEDSNDNAPQGSLQPLAVTNRVSFYYVGLSNSDFEGVQ